MLRWSLEGLGLGLREELLYNSNREQEQRIICMFREYLLVDRLLVVLASVCSTKCTTIFIMHVGIVMAYLPPWVAKSLLCNEPFRLQYALPNRQAIS